MGAWLTYGLGSESQTLPGYLVLQSGPRGPRGGAHLWGSGFLPTTYQGVPFRSGGDPIVKLGRPPGITADRQLDTVEAVRDLNRLRLDKTRDPEIATRIAAYEMAHRMQTSAPELIDLSKESQETLEAYGAEPGKASYENNCLLARRLIERGVRFVQLYHTDWDHHGDTNLHLGEPLAKTCKGGPADRRATSRPEAAGALGLHAGDLGRGVRADTDGRDPREGRPQPPH